VSYGVPKQDRPVRRILLFIPALTHFSLPYVFVVTL
jgi:hypothetical protein